MVTSRFFHRSKGLVPLRRLVLTSVGVACLFAFISTQNAGQKLTHLIAFPTEFKLRQSLNQDPALDSRVQIFVVDDSTARHIKRETLSLTEWETIIAGFKDQKPRAVLVDKIFGIPSDSADAARFAAAMKKLPYPVIAGGFVVPSTIRDRPLLKTYPLLEKITSASTRVPKGTDELNWLPIEPGNPYGPDQNILPAFKHVGHIMYFGDGFVKPVIRTTAYDGLFAAPLLTAKDAHFDASQLVIDGSPIPTDKNGKTLINFVSPSRFFDRAESVMQLLQLAKEKKPFPKIIEDSVIVFLPNHFTGNVDYKETPFGTYPGGYVITSIVNSVVTGRWIRTASAPWIYPLIFGSLASLVLLFSSGYLFWVTLLAGVLLMFSVGVLFFVYAGISLPWLFSILSFSVTGVVVFAMNAGEGLKRKIEGVAGTSSPLEVKYDEKTGFPKRLGRYHVLERIGAGGMGEVYHAKIFGASGFEKEFALKRIAPQYWKNESIVQSFLDEARLSSYLVHRNIVQVFELLRLEDSYLLVMEYVQGRSLRETINRAKKTGLPLPPELAVYIVSEICQALEYAHSKTDPKTGRALKLVHRDISPQNILLSTDGNVRVIDFGIAKGTQTTEQTKTGLIKGKLGYMSPEQAAGKPVDRRSDLFSTALLLYEMLTHRRAFGETHESEIDALRAAKNWDMDPSQIRSLHLPDRLKAILEKGLQREPEQRYQKAAEFRRDLTEFISKYQFSVDTYRLADFLTSLEKAPVQENTGNVVQITEKTAVLAK